MAFTKYSPGTVDNSTRVRIAGVDYFASNEGVDASTQCLVTVDYDLHKINAGAHYFIKDTVDLSLNAVYDIQFTTPDTAVWSHLTFEVNTEAECAWYIYEGVTINTAGTTKTPVNNNRNSTNTSGNTIATISNSDVTNANADTAVSGATELSHGIIGAFKSSGTQVRDDEIILKRNTAYCFRMIANVAGFVNFFLKWYEHQSKN